MLIAEINTMLGQTGLPKTYYSWPEDDPAHPVPPLPYIVWYFPNTDNFAADDRVYSHIEALNIELYTRSRRRGRTRGARHSLEPAGELDREREDVRSFIHHGGYYQWLIKSNTA